MNAEDTVMDLTDMGNYSLKIAMTSILKQQAEVSFRAGYEQSVLDNDEWIHDGYLKGIREVIRYLVSDDNGLQIEMRGDKWGKQLKEWGIEG